MTESDRRILSVEEVCQVAQANGIPIVPDSLARDDSGSDFVVYHCISLDGTAWIIRLPRRDSVAAGIPAEARLLELVRPILEVQVPEWRVVTSDLVAYRRMRGVPAALEDPESTLLHWNLEQTYPPDAYIADLANTMASLHAVPRDDVLSLGIPVRTPEDVRQVFADRLERGRQELAIHESWVARGNAWLEHESWWPKETVLIHGDLHPGHTLVDDIGNITGILDWSDAEVGDPGQEFIECSRKFPPPTVDRLMVAYAAAGGWIWDGMSENIREGIAFAPLYLGLLGIDTFQQRYVEKGKAVLMHPVSLP